MKIFPFFRVLQVICRYSDAEPFFKDELVKKEESLPQDHPFLASAELSLADFYSYDGQYKMARVHYKKMLAIIERAREPNHPDVATALTHIGSFYFQYGESFAA